MSEYFNRSKTKERHYTEPGSTEANDYQITIDKKGHKVLKQSGTHDIYEEIQSYAEECKIENILARAAAGDLEILNQRQGVYADITNTPKNLAEAQNSILKLKHEFEALPAETREKFDNSVEKFVMDFGSESWKTAMGYKKAEEATEITFDGLKTNEALTPEVKE